MVGSRLTLKCEFNGAMTLGITTFGILINKMRHAALWQSIVMLSVVTPN